MMVRLIDTIKEYPAAPDRGGAANDTANFVTCLRELKLALGAAYMLSVTLPTSYWYLRGVVVMVSNSVKTADHS